MIATLIAAAALSASPTCPNIVSTDKLVQELSLPSGGRTLRASSYTVPGLGPRGIAATRLVVVSPRCELLFEQEFEGTNEIKLTTVTLGKTPLLIASALSPGGSGCGIAHVVLTYDGTPEPLAPGSLGHSNMGAVFVGDLGHGKGPGLVLFDALWEGGSHYEPHPYQVWTYSWKDQRFIGPTFVKTKPMTPDPTQVAKALGYTLSKDMVFEC
jgi:hypothetical protein